MRHFTMLGIAAASFASGYALCLIAPGQPLKEVDSSSHFNGAASVVAASQSVQQPSVQVPACPVPDCAVAEVDAEQIVRKQVPLTGVCKGPLDAPITIVEFSDFQCPFSARVAPTIDQLIEEYPRKIRVYFRHNPLPFHLDAALAAEAAVAAESADKFWEMHDKLIANPHELKREHLEKYAQELGLDMKQFEQALETRVYKVRIDQDWKLGERIGVSGTPIFFINGRLLRGAQPIEAFRSIIDEELAIAEKLIDQGTMPGKVYDELMAAAAAIATEPVRR
jgi:protein-disulfide isomerase